MNEEILKRLDVLAAKLGVTAQMLWDVLVRQARIEAITDTVIALICAAILVAYGLYVRLFCKKFPECEYGEEDGWIAGVIGGGIVSLVIGIIAVCLICSAVTEWLNPQYWALKQILEAAGK